MSRSHNKCSLSLIVVSFNQDSRRVILPERDLTSLVCFIFYKQLDSLQNQKQTKMYFEIFWIIFIKLEKTGIFPELSYQVSKYESLTSFSNVL